MIRILGLDPASSFGWALLENDQYIDGGRKQFKPPTKAQLKKGISRGKKWEDALTWIETLKDHDPDFIILEDVKRHVSTLSAHSYGFYRYAIEAMCHRNNITFYPIGVTQWKKKTIDQGNAGKEIIMEKMQELYPDVKFESDDHSDALGIAYSGYLYYKENILEELTNNFGGKKKK